MNCLDCLSKTSLISQNLMDELHEDVFLIFFNRNVYSLYCAVVFIDLLFKPRPFVAQHFEFHDCGEPLRKIWFKMVAKVN